MVTARARPAAAPKKRLGQHFLTASHYARRIAEEVPALPDEPVVEIGPGTGALTEHLVARFPRLHCVEKDGDVLGRLRERLGPGQYTVHHADALEFDYSLVGFPLHAVGNLPYGVAAMILRRVLLLGSRVRSCTFMLQREVAERIVAGPHSKRHGFLTVFCGFFGKARALLRVPRGAFFPQPNVDSTVVQILVDPTVEQRLPPDRWEDFFAFVDQGSRMRRKKVVNVLRNACPVIDFGAAFARLGLDPMSRAEDLGVGEWLSLYRDVYPC